MIEIPHCGFGMMQMPFERQNHVRLAFAFAVQELADLGKSRLQLFQLGRRQFHLPARVCDFHRSTLSRICAYSRTRRWWVDGIFISSRYFATVRRVTLMPWPCSMVVICSSVRGLPRSSSSIIFFTMRFSSSNGVELPEGPCTASEKKYRNSKTPCGVWTYLLATARLTVEGCTPTSSATSLIIMGFKESSPWLRNSVWRRTMAWQTLRMVCLRCSIFFIN